MGGGERDFPQTAEDERREARGKLTGDGLQLFGPDDDDGREGNSGIGVNSFLWRATLDTVSFLPITSADPHGGTILTDWYENPEARGERFKVNVFILGTRLRSDGVRANVFKQIQDRNGNWRDQPQDESLNRSFEDKILTRARELRIKSAS